MDIDVLRTFLEVSKTRHFAKAAENLFLSQSTVSARIKLLEDTVGVPVFTRDRNNIQLTAAGERLMSHANNMIATWNRTLQEISVANDDKIVLVLGGLPSLWDIMLSNWIQVLHSKKPQYVINAEVSGYQQLLRHLIERLVDVAFMFDSPEHGDLETVDLGEIPIVMVSAEADYGLDQCFDERYVLVDWGTSFSVSHSRLFPDLTPPRLRVAQGRLAHEFILSRGGSAYLAEPMVREDLRAGRLHRVIDAPVIPRSAFAAYHARSERVDEILEALSLLVKKTDSRRRAMLAPANIA